MKLSDIKGDRVFEVIAEIIEPIANIAENKQVAALFKREKCPDGLTSGQFFMQRLKTALPALMTDNKDDLVTILASIKGQGKDEYIENVNMASLASDVFELMSDEEFLGFLSQNNNDKA